MSTSTSAFPVSWPTQAYAAGSGGFLFLQGSSTLLARLVPEIDAAIPWLLDTTQLVPLHSLLHLATAGLALLALLGNRSWLFAAGFGAFYTLLAAAGWLTNSGLCLALQPFDHPFHLVLGLLGLGAAAAERRLNWRGQG